MKIEVRMISELNGEFLVCLEADPILFMAAKRSVRDCFFYTDDSLCMKFDDG
jgi:hypothetical protein